MILTASEQIKTLADKVNWRLTAIFLSAILASQMLHSLFILIAGVAFQSTGNYQYSTIVYLLSSITAVLLGGAYLGRLIPHRYVGIWLLSGVLNAISPVIIQSFMSGFSREWFMHIEFWFNALGSILIWYLGALAGYFSRSKYPSGSVDEKLFKIVGISVVALILINYVSWAAIHFSNSYRLAREISVPLPPEATETPAEPPDPWIAQFRRFEMTVPPFDKSVMEWYGSQFKSPEFEDVTEKFDAHEFGKWVHIQRQIEDQNLDYYLATARWRDLSGKVMVTVFLQADKENPDREWSDTDWKITGVAYSRPYSEPQPQSTPVTGQQTETPAASPVSGGE